MNYPSGDRYSEFVQNPTVYFLDPSIRERRVQTDALGLPEVQSGGFAFTYQFSGIGSDIALRCFHRYIPDLFERYKAISVFLKSVRSQFFVDFTFLEHGLATDGATLPVVTMQWIEGETLLGYLSRRRADRLGIANLRDQLVLLSDELEKLSFAHGDIQHRNIMVTNSGVLKLVDYDAMFVPALKHLRGS
jgi:hypothetical protein